MGVPEKDPLSQLSLPPGFRFYPTDEELLVQYLCRKVAGNHFSLEIIAEIDLYKFDPWVLPGKAIFGEKEWYFFSPRDRKYPNGSRPNRVAGSGYWKATGTDKIITTEGKKLGIKKALVFYVGKAPKGTKTNWIMHEYRLLDSSRKNTGTKLDDWVLCRIYKKNSSAEKAAQNSVVSMAEQTQYSNGSSSSSSSHLDEVLESLPAINDRCLAVPRVNTLQQQNHLGSGGLMDWTNHPVSDFVSGNQVVQQEDQTRGIVNYNTSNHNDLYVPTMCHVESLSVPQNMEEEVQSGVRNQRVDNNSWFLHNDFTQWWTREGFSTRFAPSGFGSGNEPAYDLWINNV